MTKPANSLFQPILVFDTTSRDQTSVALVIDDKIEKRIAPVLAQDLQVLADQQLKSAKIVPQDIKQIAVLVGPGSYTGTRMGVAAANTLGWLLDKPIVELDGDSLERALYQLTRTSPKIVKKATVRY